ncbi:hypothetical protein EDC04DRAFT_2771977 [Pisolithus marmoratus]|nr:hypothetical protein EDC04DRAFT_2771977 [Pisolithus marmoratus]
MSQVAATSVEGIAPIESLNTGVAHWEARLFSRWTKALAWKLDCIDFCKEKRMKDKRHEFLILHFSRHENPLPTAVVIVERGPLEGSPKSAVKSPHSTGTAPVGADDRACVLGQGQDLQTWVNNTNGEYEVLCTLKYKATEGVTPPSAMQISVLTTAVHYLRTDYLLLENNCYWYCHTVFDACQKLFAKGTEKCYNHDARGRWNYGTGGQLLDLNDIDLACDAYKRRWENLVREHEAEQNELAQQLKVAKLQIEEEKRGREEERQGREKERKGKEKEKREREKERRRREKAERLLKKEQNMSEASKEQFGGWGQLGLLLEPEG